MQRACQKKRATTEYTEHTEKKTEEQKKEERRERRLQKRHIPEQPLLTCFLSSSLFLFCFFPCIPCIPWWPFFASVSRVEYDPKTLQGALQEGEFALASCQFGLQGLPLFLYLLPSGRRRGLELLR